jgi:hypothetical protein
MRSATTGRRNSFPAPSVKADIDSGAVEQLTNDPVNKYAGFMFQAPDFDDSYIFFTLADHTAIQVFEQTGFNPGGSPAFTLVNTITSPALSPKTPMFNILVTANSLPARQRLDPVITPNGPSLYYNRIVPSTDIGHSLSAPGSRFQQMWLRPAATVAHAGINPAIAFNDKPAARPIFGVPAAHTQPAGRRGPRR